MLPSALSVSFLLLLGGSVHSEIRLLGLIERRCNLPSDARRSLTLPLAACKNRCIPGGVRRQEVHSWGEDSSLAAFEVGAGRLMETPESRRGSTWWMTSPSS